MLRRSERISRPSFKVRFLEKGKDDGIKTGRKRKDALSSNLKKKDGRNNKGITCTTTICVYKDPPPKKITQIVQKKVKESPKDWIPLDLNPKIITVQVEGVDFVVNTCDSIDCMDEEEANAWNNFDIKHIPEELQIVPYTKPIARKKSISVQKIVKEENQATASLPLAIFCKIEDCETEKSVWLRHCDYIHSKKSVVGANKDLQNYVEYELNELDVAWLELVNEERKEKLIPPINQEVMEFLLNEYEKESCLQLYREGGESTISEQEAYCCICGGGESCMDTDVIILCDICNIPVHQYCYGVPYIPEGQWLCKRCLLSPFREVNCIFCPNKGGAMKKTDDGKWAHVICAIWLPEIWFANLVFLEPIEGADLIPESRKRLTCFICKCKRQGACIQCHKPHCYTAFHVTCAKYAGIYMQTIYEEKKGQEIVKKIAYCNNHAPENYMKDNKLDSSILKQTMKECRKSLTEKRKTAPVFIPNIFQNSEIDSTLSKAFNSNSDKEEFIKLFKAYWKLKRI